MEFKSFSLEVKKKLDELANTNLFKTDLSKDELWECYISSFTDDMQWHNCNACRSFIKNYGNLVTVIDNKLVSIWDVTNVGKYELVAKKMGNLVKSKPIHSNFLNDTPKLGFPSNPQKLESGEIITWNHFHGTVSNKFVSNDINSVLGSSKTAHQVFMRALKEITTDSVQTVLDLIADGSLYRGNEAKELLISFQTFQSKFYTIEESLRDNFVWEISEKIQFMSRIRNTSIGTLLVDLSEGKDLEIAVKAYEVIMAPTNYKRPTALISKKMIEDAHKKVEELNLTDSLERRHAAIEDITINNVLYADRNVKKAMNVFEELSNEVKVSDKSIAKVTEISIDNFIKDVLPTVESMEVLVENKHFSNLVTLTAPTHKNAEPLFKWGNNFGWTYNGDVADSIKERVKKAGGNVEGFLRCSLFWFNHDDLDISIEEPNGNLIYFGRKLSNRTKGELDIDMNAGSGHTREAVENIIYPSECNLLGGDYKVIIHNYCKRETQLEGFVVEMEFNGKTLNFNYDKAVKHDERVTAVTFNYSKKDGIKIVSSLPCKERTQTVYNITSQTFVKVNAVMLSPNYWDERGIGNKHYLFMLKDCLNPNPVRCFFNEFLRNDLNEHRKVFEVLGSKMMAQYSDNQLSGLGFSSTIQNSIICKVTGSYTRTLKINF